MARIIVIAAASLNTGPPALRLNMSFQQIQYGASLHALVGFTVEESFHPTKFIKDLAIRKENTMLTKIKNAYHTNPILFIHIAAFVIAVIFVIASQVFLIVTGIDSIPDPIRDANMVLYTAAIAFWLAYASKKQIPKHKNDASKITYIALILYSGVLFVAAIRWVLSLVITVFSSLM